jgi:hypothetical protein
MKSASLLLLSLLFITACGREESTSYQVPKAPAPTGPTAQPMGSDADNQAVMNAHAAMAGQTQDAGFKSELPDGWTEQPGSGMRKISYTIEGTAIDFYLISLSTGDVPSNVNRWRGQVGLPPATPEDIAKEIVALKAGGHDVNYAEIYNEEGGKGIVAAIIALEPQYWYFTAKGSVDELKANTSDIRTFLESITFDGHNH